MKTLPFETGFIIVLAMGLLLSSCAGAYQNYPSYLEPLEGDVQAVRVTSVLRELRFAVMGSLRSYIYVNEATGNVLFTWPAPGGVAWVCLNGQTANVCNALRAIGLKGNLANLDDFRSVMKTAFDMGYRPVDPTTLAKMFPGLVTSIIESTSSFANQVIPSIIVIPVIPGMFDNPDMPGYTTIQ